MPMAAKLGRMVTYLERPLPKKSHDHKVLQDQVTN